MTSREVHYRSWCALVLGLSIFGWLIVGNTPLPALASNHAQPAVCNELVVNGGFETAGAGWSLLPSEYLPRYVSDITYAESALALRLGAISQLNVAAISVAEQTIELPPDRELVLSFFTLPVYSGRPTDGDVQTVEIVDRDSGERLLTVLTSQLNANAWMPARYNLSIFAGRTIRLRFLVSNDGSQDSDGLMAMFVDQVSVLACPPGVRPVFPTSTTESATPPSTLGASLQETQVATPTVTIAATPTQAITATATLTPTATDSSTETPTVTPTRPSPTSTPAATSTPTLTPTAAPPPLDDPAVCACSADYYSCGDFPSWSAAQACYSHCRSSVGFDVHQLDEDGDNLSCELQLEIDPDVVTTTATITDELALLIEPWTVVSSTITTSTQSTGGPETDSIQSAVPGTEAGTTDGDAGALTSADGAAAQGQPASANGGTVGVAGAVWERLQQLSISPIWLLICIFLLVFVVLAGVVATYLLRMRQTRTVKAQIYQSQDIHSLQ